MIHEQDKWLEKLTGSFFPAVPVPFNFAGMIHTEAQTAYARWMGKQPVSGVAIWAHTGRGLFLNGQQRKTVFQTWRANLEPDHAIICGVGSRYDQKKNRRNEDYFLAESMGMAEQAKHLGADALLVYPPEVYAGAADKEFKIIAYHRMLAGYGLPLIIFYLYNAAGGILYSESVLRQLLALKQTAGIKMATLDSIMTYQRISTLVRAEFPDKVLISGEDRFLGYSYIRGAKAALVGLGAISPDLQTAMVAAYCNGEHARFLDLMGKVDQLAECTFIQPMDGYIQRILYVLALQNIIPIDAAYDPFGPGINEMERGKIRKTLMELNLLSCP